MRTGYKVKVKVTHSTSSMAADEKKDPQLPRITKKYGVTKRKPVPTWKIQAEYNQRKVKKLKRRVQKLCSIPSMPFMALIATDHRNMNVHIVGQPEIVAQLRECKELTNAFQVAQKKKPLESSNPSVDLRGISLALDVHDFPEKMLRKIISQLVISKGPGSRTTWGDDTKRPEYWAREIPFQSPSTSFVDHDGVKRRCLTMALMQEVLSSWRMSVIKKLAMGYVPLNSADTRQYLEMVSKKAPHPAVEEKVSRKAPHPAVEEKVSRKAPHPAVEEKDSINSVNTLMNPTPSPSSSAKRYLEYNNILILEEDVSRVERNQWLEDRVVLWFLTYLRDLEGREDVTIMDPSFPVALLCSQRTPIGTHFDPMQSCNMESGLKYLKHIDISNTNLVLMPICDNTHWTLAVYDSTSFTIYMLCSLGGRYLLRGDALKRVFAAEYERRGRSCPQITVIHPEVPKQYNGVDCGVFVMFYGKALMKASSLDGVQWQRLVSSTDVTENGRREILISLQKSKKQLC